MYRIHSCTLTGFKRMLVNNIRKFTITPHMAVQLILGTNGSGKSSLINQLTPLPSVGDDFIKGGSKVFVAEVNGVMVVASSTFNTKAGDHSFIYDGKELNEGSTSGVQRDLVKKYFGITPDIHDLMRGAEKFTRMKAAERREWFTRMCDTDYSFAMSAYEKIKERANWLTGAVKMGKKNLGVEIAKIMSEAEEVRLENEVNALLEELAILQSERQPVPVSSEEHLDAALRALKALDELALRLIRHRVVAPLQYTGGAVEYNEWGQLKRVDFQGLDQLDTEIDRLKHIATDRQAVLVTLNEQFSKYDRQHKLLLKTGAEGVEGLTKQIAALKEDNSALVKKLRLGLVFENAKAAREALDSISLNLTSAIAALPINTERQFGRAKYQELQAQQIKLNERIREVQEQLQRRVAAKEHADQHRGQDKHSCPQCHHTWVVGVNEAQYEQLVLAIKEAEKNLKVPVEEREQLGEQLKTIEVYFDQYREVMAFTKNVTVLKPFWDELLASQNLFDAPNEAVTMVQHAHQDLVYSVEIQLGEERIRELEKLKLAAEDAGDAKLEDVQDQMEMVSERLGQVTADHQLVQRSLADYTDYRRQLKQGLDMAEEVARMENLAQRAHWDQIEAFRRECIQSCINQVEQALALRQESLRSAKMQKALVEKLKEQIAKDEVHEAAAKTLVKALSPTHGLIAEGLLGFIRNFVGQMNTFIGRIWAYPLQLIPTGYNNEDGEQTSELDYKFKMIVENENNIVPDVSKGSEGIMEMVDLAFKMAAVRSLGLSDAPLFLDEFGKSLDDQHRFAATEEIRWMMENGNHPQLFMISHYSASYAAFSNSEICVIDDRNVTVPGNREYNKHVQIVH